MYFVFLYQIEKHKKVIYIKMNFYIVFPYGLIAQ
jgi:hypothetical protein